MNERTEALAKQAAEYAIEFAVKDQEIYIPRLMEKFAELIVKECGVALTPMLCDMVSRGQAYDLIKKHFGVKE
jgi:hypothetical protein